MFIFHFLHGNRNRVVQHCYMELRRIVWLRWHTLQWFCIVASIVVGHLVSRAGWFHLKVGRKEFSIINQSLNQSVYQSINQSVSQTNNFCFGHSAGPLLLQYRNSGFSDVKRKSRILRSHVSSGSPHFQHREPHMMQNSTELVIWTKTTETASLCLTSTHLDQIPFLRTPK